MRGIERGMVCCWLIFLISPNSRSGRILAGEVPTMWVFGYGSLMWDGWEQPFGGTHVDGAVLADYRRSCNKKSTRNWGTSVAPGPTLGLEPAQNAICTGTAFESGYGTSGIQVDD